MERSPLFATLIPSVVRTLEAGFEVRIYAAYDVGDPLYDSDSSLREAEELFHKVVAVAAKPAGATVRLALCRFLNTLQKPGPAFNFAAAAAHADGADYLYRVNDDTQLLAPWARRMVAALAGLSPPNLGVVGPACGQGSVTILTHDFTHRTHMRLFGTYYPWQLPDWWMDNWISAVYPANRTMRHRQAAVRHRLSKRRYAVDKANGHRLQSSIDAGRRIVDAVLRRCAVPADSESDELEPPANLTAAYDSDGAEIFQDARAGGVSGAEGRDVCGLGEAAAIVAVAGLSAAELSAATALDAVEYRQGEARFVALPKRKRRRSSVSKRRPRRKRK